MRRSGLALGDINRFGWIITLAAQDMTVLCVRLGTKVTTKQVGIGLGGKLGLL
jgi:hypothetical protein